jgi:hypothetical protein
MTQADSVHSTPRKTASKINPPVDPTRRHLLTLAAAGAIAAAIPTAALVASPEIDPAFALIAEKRAADVAHCEAIDAQDEAEDQHGDNSDEAGDRRRCRISRRAPGACAEGREGRLGMAAIARSPPRYPGRLASCRAARRTVHLWTEPLAALR